MVKPLREVSSWIFKEKNDFLSLSLKNVPLLNSEFLQCMVIAHWPTERLSTTELNEGIF